MNNKKDMPKKHLPIYQIQDFNAQAQKEPYFYLSPLAAHLKEHLFIQEPHKHNFYIILFVTQGKGTHTIDFRKCEVNPNMIFFMIPGQVHSWELTEDADGFIVFFTQEFYSREFPHRKLYNFPFFTTLLHKPFLMVSQDKQPALMQNFQTMLKEYLNQKLMTNEMLSCYLNILLIYLTRMYQTEGTAIAAQGGALSLLQTLENLIEQHYKEHLPVTYYAEQLHVTTKHLKEVCKRSLGKTTKELLHKRSILEAQRLLVHSALTSSQIAAELGYSDTAYFFRFFKKHTGCTPEQFRSSNK